MKIRTLILLCILTGNFVYGHYAIDEHNHNRVEISHTNTVVPTIEEYSYAIGQDIAFHSSKDLSTNFVQSSFVKGLLEEYDAPAEYISYIIGKEVGKTLADQGTNLIKSEVLTGITFYFSNSSIFEYEKNDAIKLIYLENKHRIEQKKIEKEHKKQLKLLKKKYANARKLSADFLNKNQALTNVITTDSGLQYTVLKEGEFDKDIKPELTDKVIIHLIGYRTDGTEFDNTYSRGYPFTIPLTGFGVLKGWTEGIQKMRIGSKYRFFLSPELGYGDMGYPSRGVQPYSVVIYDIELLGIKK